MKRDLELFAGPGGTSEGMRLQGQPSALGIEWNADACTTARLAGHLRRQVDITTVDPREYQGAVRGIGGSPTCRPFSPTGTGAGAWDLVLVMDLLDAYAAGVPAPDAPWRDPRSALTAEPMRWVHALQPQWLMLEQVPAVLPVWMHLATLLRQMGYHVATGVVRAADFGVSTSRRRAVLLAHSSRAVALPRATHNVPVTMGQALGLEDDGRVLVSNYGTNGDPRDRGRRRLDQLAPTMTGKCGRNKWVWPDGSSRNLSIPEAAVLQGFRADYPFSGGSISQQQQVGDAVPPPLAAALLGQLLGSSSAGATEPAWVAGAA